MDYELIAKNFLSAPVLFFLLGVIAVAVKSDLHIPDAIGKFLSMYLLFDIGIKGGEELFHSGFTSQVLIVIACCVGVACIVPLIAYRILRLKLDTYNAGAIAATYGSVSAVTFATAMSFLQHLNVSYGGYMVAGMAFMESPAIVIGLYLIRTSVKRHGGSTQLKEGQHKSSNKEVLREAFFNGSIILLIGSVLIGYVAGNQGEEELRPFVSGIFKGMLCLYLLDMGTIAGARMSALKESGFFLIIFAILFPLLNAVLGVAVSYVVGFNLGDAFLFTILCASASYIAVPAAIRMAVPQANMSLLLPMALGVTFPFNVMVGIPL
jgi:uncharacterized protein